MWEGVVMLFQGILTSSEKKPYIDPRVADLEKQMNATEKAAATVDAYELKAIEPGADEAYVFRLPAANLTVNLDDVLFLPVTIETRGMNARGFVKSGQTSRSVDADTTFQAISLVAMKREELLAFNARRQKIAEEEQAKKDARKDEMTKLKESIEQRIAKLASGGDARNGK
jgi:hypothetical protein